MRILKEYAVLSKSTVLDDTNSMEFPLKPEIIGDAVEFIKAENVKFDTSPKTLGVLTTAADDIISTLTQNAGLHETLRIACSFHKYYYTLMFEFSETALPLHTLNKSVKVLSIGKNNNADTTDNDTEIGFMNIVHLVNRVDVSVDKINEKMRITVIKEKKYTRPETKVLSNEFCAKYSSVDITDELVVDFTARIYNEYGASADTFLTIPSLFLDNINSNELEAIIIRDKNGNAAGGVVWQHTYGITVMMIAVDFTPDNALSEILKLEFSKRIKDKTNFIVVKSGYEKGMADYFDICDEQYCYKSIENANQKRLTSYIKPDLMPLLKKAYTQFEVSRDIREINYTHKFIEPYSVLTAKIDTVSSEALLSILWSGDDIKSNILRHIIAFKRVGIEKIYFRLDLSLPDQAAISDLVQSCGFDAKYLWPYSADNGDIVVFCYNNAAVYEMKPCEISPINKGNTVLTPSLVRSVYGENYPSQYLYEPEKLWEKIRKRSLYPFIAVDDDKKAVGMISFVKLSANPYLFEIGQLMVRPEDRGTDVASQLIDYLYTNALTTLDFDAVLSESVTNHKFSQRSCCSSGFVDVALKLNIMSADAFNLENERRQIGRMSCVVSCVERADESFIAYLPKVYEDKIKYCFEGLKPRTFDISQDTLPDALTITEYQINEDEVTTSSLINVTFFKIGTDIEAVVEKINEFAQKRDVKSMLVNIPLGDKYNARAVKLLKSFGFFFGGIMPYWLPESDALLMQKLYNNAPDWNSIKLFSKKIKNIAQMIKDELE